jgi:putative ABC transport system substrate-binding protein
VIVTGGIPAVMAVKASGTRPGRNFSGATVLNTELVPKRLEMLHELVPAASSFAVLLNPSNRNAEGQWRDLQEAARGRRLQLHRLHASNDHEIDAALRTSGVL